MFSCVSNVSASAAAGAQRQGRSPLPIPCATADGCKPLLERTPSRTGTAALYHRLLLNANPLSLRTVTPRLALADHTPRSQPPRGRTSSEVAASVFEGSVFPRTPAPEDARALQASTYHHIWREPSRARCRDASTKTTRAPTALASSDSTGGELKPILPG